MVHWPCNIILFYVYSAIKIRRTSWSSLNSLREVQLPNSELEALILLQFKLKMTEEFQKSTGFAATKKMLAI